MIVISQSELCNLLPKRVVEEIAYFGDRTLFAWYQQALVYREGYTKPKIHLEKFIELYKEHHRRMMERQFEVMRSELRVKERAIDGLLDKYREEHSVKWIPHHEWKTESGERVEESV